MNKRRRYKAKRRRARDEQVRRTEGRIRSLERAGFQVITLDVVSRAFGVPKFLLSHGRPR